MQLYEHTGKGHYIGSRVIVWAGSLDTASKMIRKTLDANFLKSEEHDIECLGGLGQKPSVIMCIDGDY